MDNSHSHATELHAILPFQTYDDWLKWKRERQLNDETEDGEFVEPNDPWGFDNLHSFEASEIANEITSVIGPIRTISSDSNQSIVKQLSGAIALLQGSFISLVDLQQLGKRMDLKKMMVSDAITILLQEFGVAAAYPDFLVQWRGIRRRLLTEKTQLAAYRKRTPAEDPFLTVFCTWTYWILKINAKLSVQEIRKIQKVLYTHFLVAHSPHHLHWPCQQYNINEEEASVSYPLYDFGKLIESKNFWIGLTKTFNPGNLVEKKPTGMYRCKHYRSEGRKGSSHCSNGNYCYYIDHKIDNWYKHVNPDLLKTPPAGLNR